jgi:ribonuclease P protein component
LTSAADFPISPRSRKLPQSQGKESRDVEAHLPAQQDREKASPRLSCSQIDRRRPQGPGKSPRARPQEAVGLTDIDWLLSLKGLIGAIAQEATLVLSRLKVRADFLRLARGRKWSAPGLVLQMQPTPAELASKANAVRVGFTVTKKVGDAVRRNRAKRRLREVARAVLPLYGVGGTDYVLIGRDGTLTRSFADLIADLRTALRKTHGGTAHKAERE